MKEQTHIRLITRSLGLYFFLMGTDAMPVGNWGSLLRLFALLPGVLVLFDLKNLKVRISPVTVILLLYTCYGGLSLLWSIERSLSIKRIETLFLNVILVLAIGMMETFSQSETEFLLRALLIGNWISAAIMLLFGQNSAENRLTLNFGDSSQDANYVNGYLLFAFAWHLHSFLEGKGIRHLVLAGFLLFIGICTGSRGALLAYIVIFIMNCVLTVVDRKSALKTLVQLMLIAGFILLVLQLADQILPANVLERFTWSYIQKKGTTGRSATWAYLWKHFCQDGLWRQWFGHGYGTTGTVNQLVQRRVAHNLYLDNLISMGIVGVVLQLSMQISYLITMLHLGNKVMLATYCGYLTMCLSLSLTSYKPLWSIMMMTMILLFSSRDKEMVLLDRKAFYE